MSKRALAAKAPDRSAITLGVLATLAAGSTAARPAEGLSGEPREILWEEGVKNAYPHWSKDASRIVFQSNRSGKWHIYLMDPDGSRQVQLTHGNSNNNLPDWSPDNTAIAFVSDREGNEEIYVMGSDGTGLRNLSDNPASDIHPYWSPDGAQILFNSTRAGAKLQIYAVSPDGTALTRLVTSADDDSCARVSPKGDRIVYLTNLSAGRDDVIVRNRDGSNPINITSDEAPDGWPAWTPDGERIVFASQRSGTFALYVMQPDGSNARQITFPPPGYADARPNVSPDGKSLVFNREHGDTIGILSVDLPASVLQPQPRPNRGWEQPRKEEHLRSDWTPWSCIESSSILGRQCVVQSARGIGGGAFTGGLWGLRMTQCGRRPRWPARSEP